MTTLYVCDYDCQGKFRLRREDFAGTRYPKNTSAVNVKHLKSCSRLHHARRQQAQWHGDDDAAALQKAAQLAADYATCGG